MKRLLSASNRFGTTKTYVVGFAISLALTLEAYFLVDNQMLSAEWLVAAVVGLAVIQLIAQLVFFLHLGREPRPRWNLTVFVFMLTVLVILVGGSLWIMYNLNYHMMPAPETDQQIIQDEGIYR